MQLLAAMAPPGGGRGAFSGRILAVFSPICMTQPGDGQLRRVFSAILGTKLAEFNDEVRHLLVFAAPPAAGVPHRFQISVLRLLVLETDCTYRHTPPQVRPLCEPLVAASVELYRSVVAAMLPTPSKSHYLFNTRDLAKIIFGVMQVNTSSRLYLSATTVPIIAA